MKRLLPSLLLALALIAPAVAKEFKLPDDSPKVSIQFPEDWETGETNAGVEAQNKEHNAYLALESADNAEDQDELVGEMVKH